MENDSSGAHFSCNCDACEQKAEDASEMTKEGTRIRLISMKDPYAKLRPGALGVVEFCDDAGTVFVKWEDGSSIGLIPGEDEWEVVKREYIDDTDNGEGITWSHRRTYPME